MTSLLIYILLFTGGHQDLKWQDKICDCTFMTGLQLNLSTVVAVASIGSGSHPKHIGGAWLQPLHRHHVAFGFQNRVVLISLVLEGKEFSQ